MRDISAMYYYNISISNMKVAYDFANKNETSRGIVLHYFQLSNQSLWKSGENGVAKVNA